ncbi:lytic transglycosylase domain-containing protein [Shewanella gelidii]|uniref:Lytic transglycosylase n=1 Tax=Shewanella gelidii TaxID=1642821 RepID=A0A917NA33_9GAMM|nr:lytic transglycosylase domain-containing protein [Shewanella gelidii]MCL1099125.1 lytic transglycosylase domain-containing protein [Shewanella gelidii]GGI81533.1 lytic transglycosylase [Shewanella gelidii]
MTQAQSSSFLPATSGHSRDDLCATIKSTYLTVIVAGLCAFSLNLSAQPKDAKQAASTKPHIVASFAEKGLSHSKKHEKVQVYQYEQANGVMVFSDTRPAQGNFQVHLYDCFACKPESNINWKSIKLFTKAHQNIIELAAKQHRLEPALIRAVIHAESAFDAKAISRSGAMGLMQLMPDTANDMGVLNAFKPEQNIQGGSRYLAQMLDRFDGDITLACAAYNAGPTTVTQYRGVPPYPETQAYVERVQILLERYRKAARS